MAATAALAAAAAAMRVESSVPSRSSLTDANAASTLDATTTNKAKSGASFDVTLLRRVLRLVHCLQKERGASCAYFAVRHSATTSNSNSNSSTTTSDDNGSSSSSSPFSQSVQPARRDTDHALQLSLLQKKTGSVVDRGDLAVAKTLATIRNMLRLDDGNGNSNSNSEDSAAGTKAAGDNSTNSRSLSGSGLHRILVCFNTLISSVIHEYVLRQTVQQAKIFSKQEEQQQRQQQQPFCSLLTASFQHGVDISISSQPKTHHRMHSHQMLQPAQLGNTNGGMPRIHSEVNFQQAHPHAVVAPAAPNAAPSSDPNTVTRLPPGVPRPPQSLVPSLAATTITKRAIAPRSPGGSTREVTFPANTATAAAAGTKKEESDSARAVRLLHLLGIFVQLKESTGVERAIISTLFADQTEQAALFMTDLVLEVESQRRRVHELQSLVKLKQQPTTVTTTNKRSPSTAALGGGIPDSYSSLGNLVQELVALNPEMLQLQQRILSGSTALFSNSSLSKDSSLDADRLWDLLTVYIDKLHSLELLIVEEIECCAPVDPSLDLIVTEEGKQEPKQQQQEFDLTVLPETLVWRQLFGSDIVTREEMASHIEAMTACDLQEQFLAALRNSNGGRSSLSAAATAGVASSSEPKGVQELLKEISGAPASKEWEIDLYEIKFQKRIGQGSAGTTYLATWSGQQVAVKVASITEMGLEGWRTEVQYLQKFHHPNIIRLLGSCYSASPLTICLVLDYCNAGDLSIAMQRLTPPNFFFHVATSIANGMAYLHGRGTMHRDIKAANVLLDGDFSSGRFSVKLTDFGFATHSTIPADRTAETGTYRWMAPEVIRHEAYSGMADVYSFAVLMWQLLTREDPFSDMSQIEAAASVAFEGARIPFPEGTPVAVRELIEICWSDDPAQRLPFDQISLRLKEIESALTDDEKAWLEASRGHPVYAKPKLRPERKTPPQLNTDHVQQPIPQNGKHEKRGGGLLGRFRTSKQ